MKLQLCLSYVQRNVAEKLRFVVLGHVNCLTCSGWYSGGEYGQYCIGIVSLSCWEGMMYRSWKYGQPMSLGVPIA